MGLPPRDLIETGLEREYTVTEIGWVEAIHGGSAVRVCFANRKHGQLVAQYTAVMSIRDMVEMIKGIGEVVSAQGGLLAWRSEQDDTAH